MRLRLRPPGLKNASCASLDGYLAADLAADVVVVSVIGDVGLVLYGMVEDVVVLRAAAVLLLVQYLCVTVVRGGFDVCRLLVLFLNAFTSLRQLTLSFVRLHNSVYVNFSSRSISRSSGM